MLDLAFRTGETVGWHQWSEPCVYLRNNARLFDYFVVRDRSPAGWTAFSRDRHRWLLAQNECQQGKKQPRGLLKLVFLVGSRENEKRQGTVLQWDRCRFSGLENEYPELVKIDHAYRNDGCGTESWSTLRIPWLFTFYRWYIGFFSISRLSNRIVFKERDRVAFYGTCIASETRAILKLFYFIFFPTDTFQTCYLKYYFFIALITMQ